jgi:nucleotide-binding universal stress UspA family protein
MKMNKILFTTKFRHLSLNSLEQLYPLKEAGLKEVVLCYIIARDKVGFVPYGGYLKEEVERLSNQARIRFEDWQQSLSQQGIDSKIIIEVGDPVPKLLRVAEDEKVDLIVAGKKNVTAKEGFFLSHGIVQIMRRSPVPVLVSKYMVEYEWNGEKAARRNDKIFERPLFAMDWSEPSKRARKTIPLLHKLVTEALVSHVITAKTSKKLNADERARMEQESRKKLETYCRVLGKNCINAEAHLGAGRNVVDEILRLSRELKASMIILGTSGKISPRNILRGNVSHRIAELSEIPTLLIP